MPAILTGRTPALAFLFALLLPILQACGGPADAQGAPPPAMPVSVAPAVQRSITDVETFSGRLEAAEFVELRPRVGGTIDKVHFTDGASVAAGALLFTIDPRPFEAEVARAESQVVAATSRAELAQTEYARAPGSCWTAGPCRARSSTSSPPAPAPARPTSRPPRPRCASRA